MLGRWLRRAECFFRGHPFVATGRQAMILFEVVCLRCGARCIGNRDGWHDGLFLDADEDFDRIIRELHEMETKCRTTN